MQRPGSADNLDLSHLSTEEQVGCLTATCGLSYLFGAAVRVLAGGAPIAPVEPCCCVVTCLCVQCVANEVFNDER